jgi:hypothetical protein
MMKKGICFFTDYHSPIPILVIALYSLRKYYSGNVCVICGSNTPPFFKNVLQASSSITDFITTDLKYPPKKGIVRLQRCFNIKPQIHKVSPYDITLMYDCDHLFVNKIEDNVFDIIEKSGLISFHRSKHGNSSDSKAILRTRKLNALGMPIKFLSQVNGGCVGSVKGSPLIDEWIANLDKMINLGHHVFTRLPDEYSLSYTMSTHGIKVGDERYSYCTVEDDASDVTEELTKKMIAVHFPRQRYFHSNIYLNVCKEAKAANFMMVRSNKKRYSACNSILSS